MKAGAALTRRFCRCLLKARAVAWLVLGCRRRALAVFEAILATAPHDSYALASQAQVLHQLGEAGEAIKVQRQLCAAHPLQAIAWFNLGFMLQEAGDAQAAEPVFRESLRLQPALDRAWYGLALSLISLGRLDRPDGALHALEKNTASQPMSPSGWYQLARVQAQLGNRPEAHAIAERLQCFEPRVAAQLRRELGQGAAWN